MSCVESILSLGNEDAECMKAEGGSSEKRGLIYNEVRRTVHLLDVYDLEEPDDGCVETRFVS
jgi:hypothetical protein